MEVSKNIELLRNYIMLRYKSYNTAKTYCNALSLFLRYFINYSEPKAINDELIIKYLLSIPGHSNRRSHHSAIKLFYRIKGQTRKFKYIPYPEKEDKLPIHVNKEEFLRLISKCTNQKHRVILCLMFDCGLRVSEVINLKLEDVDSSNMLFNIRQSKGRKDRKVKLTNVMLALLRSYYLEYKSGNYLLEGQFKEQYSIRSIQQIVKKLTKEASISKKFSPHNFRHGYAMTLLENKTTLDEIQNQLGHRSKQTTEIYARINNKVIQNIESPLEQIVKENNLLNNNIHHELH